MNGSHLFWLSRSKGMTVDIWIMDYYPPRCFQKKISHRSKHNAPKNGRIMAPKNNGTTWKLVSIPFKWVPMLGGFKSRKIINIFCILILVTKVDLRRRVKGKLSLHFLSGVKCQLLLKMGSPPSLFPVSNNQDGGSFSGGIWPCFPGPQKPWCHIFVFL
jgi:hypothetical protein